MPKKTRGGNGKHQRKAGFQPSKKGITFAPAPDPQSPMGRVTVEDGTRFRTFPYLIDFVRPLLPGEFGDYQVVKPERMQMCSYVYVTRIDPKSVARTRIPITPEQAQTYQAFGVLEKEELQEARDQGIKQGHLTLPEDTQQCTILAATLGMYTAFQAYPHLERDEPALESRARELANLRVRIWPEMVNDGEIYIRLFIPAHIFGYRYGHKMLQEITGKERTRLLEGVCFQPPLDAQILLAKVLQDHMKEIQVNSIYELPH